MPDCSAVSLGLRSTPGGRSPTNPSHNSPGVSSYSRPCPWDKQQFLGCFRSLPVTAPPRHSRFTPQIPAHPHEARWDRPSSCIPLPVWDIFGVGFFLGVSLSVPIPPSVLCHDRSRRCAVTKPCTRCNPGTDCNSLTLTCGAPTSR